MTAAIVWAVVILAGSCIFLAGEAHGRRRERIVRDRMRRLRAEAAYEELTIRLSLADAAELAGNSNHSRRVPHFEVVR